MLALTVSDYRLMGRSFQKESLLWLSSVRKYWVMLGRGRPLGPLVVFNILKPNLILQAII